MMLIRRGALFLILATGFAPAVHAACAAGGGMLFSCLTGKGKQVELCDEGKTIAYAFGRPDETPELALRVPREQASTSQWDGIGRYESYAVDVPNGDTVYSVFWSRDKLADAPGVEAGVYVLRKGRLIATVQCAPGRVDSRLQGVRLKPGE